MKKIFFIVTLFIGIAVSVQAQERPGMIKDLSAVKMVRFYPNPATAVINFEFQPSAENKQSLLIFNFMGKKVYELKNAPSRTTVNLEDFYRGIYIFQVRDKNGVIIESGKFQVAK